MRRLPIPTESGLAAGQMLLVLFLIGFVAGTGVFTVRQRTHKQTTKHSVTVPADAQVTVNGSTQAADKIDSLELSAEDKITSTSDGSYETAAKSAQDANSSFGGAYTDDSL